MAVGGLAAVHKEVASLPPNDEMQRTTPGQNGASPPISVFYGRTVKHRVMEKRERRWG